jgi:hypothetical protein
LGGACAGVRAAPAPPHSGPLLAFDLSSVESLIVLDRVMLYYEPRKIPQSLLAIRAMPCVVGACISHRNKFPRIRLRAVFVMWLFLSHLPMHISKQERENHVIQVTID